MQYRKHAGGQVHQGNRTSKSLDRPNRRLPDLGMIDSTNRRAKHTLGERLGSVCCLLGGAGGPADWQCRPARLPRNAGWSPCALSSAAVKARHIWRHSRWPRSRSCAVSFAGTRLAEPRYVQPSVSPPSIPEQFRSCLQRFMSRRLPMLAKAWSRWMAESCAAPSIRPAGSRRCAHGQRLGQRCARRWSWDRSSLQDAKSNEITAVPASYWRCSR